MRVECDVEEADVETEDGREVDGLCITCGRCGKEVTVFGRTGASERRGLVMLREDCDNGESNFYVVEEL